MNTGTKIISICLTTVLFAACEFISNTFRYKKATKEFVEALLKEDYNKCVEFMAMDHEMAKDVNVDTMKLGFADFRQVIVSNWGEELEYSLMRSEKKYSNAELDNTIPNSSLLYLEFNNKEHFGVLEVLFDDTSKKILNIRTLDIKEAIPDMTYFWLFGLLTLCIPIFNIYVIRQIKRSDLSKKWLKYVSVILFNVPAISYAAINGFSFKLLSFQILFGFSFSYMGYLNTMCTFGIPLGGLYWFWKLRQAKPEISALTITSHESQAPNQYS